MPNRRRLRPATDSRINQYQTASNPPRRSVQLRRVPVNRTVVFAERPIENSKGEQVDSLTAAAQVVNGPQHKYIPGRDTTKGRPGVQQWQNEVWDLRDETPELRFLGDRTARAASRVTLFIGRKDTPVDSPAPVADDPTIVELNTQLFGNEARVAQALKRAAQHVTCNGETYLLVSQDPDTGQLTWQAYSASEVSGSANTQITVTDGMSSRTVADDEILTRAWNPHPKLLAFPDSPVRACLPIARELKALTEMVSSQTDSRVAGAGLLLLPEGVQSAFSMTPPDDWPEDEDYTIGDELTDYMTTPVSDKASAARVVPYMLTVDPDLVDKIKHITFDSPLDETLPKLRDEAIRRLGLGMDSDPSVLLGMGGANHWSGWLVSEDEVKLGVEPCVATICHGMTIGVLHPILETLGVADPESYQVWWDATPLQLRPDRSKDAQALFDKGELTADALRRENGFGADDAPTSDEAERALLIDLIKSVPSLAPILLPILLPKLGIDIGSLADAQKIIQATEGQTPEPAPAQAPDAPPPDNTDNRSLPTRADTPDEEESK